MQYAIMPRQLITAENGGLFIARQPWTHPSRIISSHEIILLRAGRLCINEGNWQFDIKPGMFLILRSSERHTGTCESPVGTSFYWIHFVPTTINWQDNRSAIGEDFIALPQIGTLTNPERVEVLIRQFLHIQESAYYPRLALDSAIMSVLAECAAQSSHDEMSANFWAAQVKTYIEIHYNENIGTCVIAQALGLNPDYLGRVFRKGTGISIMTYLRRYRVNKAKKLLASTSMGVGEVGANIGIQNQSYFHREFRQETGISPTAYRKSYYKSHNNIY